MLKIIVLVNIFVETHETFSSRFLDEYKVQKNSIYLKQNIINVFTAPFDQCTLAEQSINF